MNEHVTNRVSVPMSDEIGQVSASTIWRSSSSINEPTANVGQTSKRSINIENLDYGYIVTIGCQKFAIETKESLIEKLTMYINRPEESEKEWMGNKTFIK